MKAHYIVISLVLLYTSSLLCSDINQNKQNIFQKQTNLAADECYCSDLCGPRKIKADDTPAWDSEKQQYFCKPRDKYNFVPHGCELKESLKKDLQ